MREVLGYDITELVFDPVQTHAVRGVPKDRVDEFKRELRAKGATRFRVVANTYIKNACTICFKMS